MRSIVAIINPAAGRGRAQREWPLYETALRAANHSLDRWTTAGPGDAREMASHARRNGCDLVIVTGGDGTVHEVANGLGPGGPPILIVPLGTGNDLARGLGVVPDPRGIVRAVQDGRVRSLDLGHVETDQGRRFFVNVSGVGFDAEVARLVHQGGGPGRGAIPYVLAMLRTLRTYRNVDLSVQVDGVTYSQRSLLVAVGNAPFYGGGMCILPGAKPDDGQFDLCIIGDLGPLQTLAVFPRVFRGTHVRHRLVRCARGTQVQISGDGTVAVHADGEPVGALPVRYRNFAGGLRVLVPRGPMGH